MMLSPRSFFVLVSVWSLATAQDQETAPDDAAANKTPPKQFNAHEHTDWGTYYDPSNIFCGKYDCYAILGFDYEHFGSPPRKEITQRYRALSREWHPDKNKARDAKDRFVKIARAYEVLTDTEKRNEYDYMRYNQEAYYAKYGSSVLWQYAPKSDALMVVIVLLVVSSALSWVIQRNKWQSVADRLTDAAVEDLGPREGGTPESKELREKALEILSQREQDTEDGDSALKKKKKSKLTGTEKKKQLQEQLRPIVKELVEERHDDFGAGYHKPTWKDLFIVKAFKFPFYFANALWWNCNYLVRRLLGKPLNDEEMEVLTIRAVGDIAWHAASEEEKVEMKSRCLWVGENMREWEEDQEIKQLSPSIQKRINRMKKKSKKIDWEKED